jgi:hypothetical protein
MELRNWKLLCGESYGVAHALLGRPFKPEDGKVQD